MTRLWLVRHGPTHARTLIGHTDRPADLSDAARLRRLSAALPHAPVVSSDLSRTRATAAAIAGDRPRRPDEPALREFHYGDWEDRAFDTFDGPLSRAFFETPGDVRPPNGESWNDVAARAGAAVARLSRGGDLILVVHFGVILTQWARATGHAPAEVLAQPVAPLSLTRIDVEDGVLHPVAVDRHP
ncbi:histidine phosphatase family protein [Jannaschia sp. Os4]|uniref:histidine phosphatase family protein n=1 Tax=Jannaschia sp. Os4 TaxID=2807617 RepID=UPI001939F119|nr:histidine phosphatase family protein [Jannaschia sp. Os4]